jgi:hypothetical protein
MTWPVENFNIGFRIFDIAAGRDAGFATLTAQLTVMFFTITSLVSHPCGFPRVYGEFGADRVITDVSWY